MNREMLLENNSIDFDRKMPNIRQQVDKQFGPNEEPIIDEFLCSVADDNLPKNIYAPALDISKVHDDVTESWSDVKEIFANINEHSQPFGNTLQGRHLENLHQIPEVDNTIIMLPNEEVSTREKILNFTTNENNLISEYVETEAARSYENKENVNHFLQKDEIVNETIPAVRQINVEMVTVTLKRKNSPTITE